MATEHVRADASGRADGMNLRGSRGLSPFRHGCPKRRVAGADGLHDEEVSVRCQDLMELDRAVEGR